MGVCVWGVGRVCVGGGGGGGAWGGSVNSAIIIVVMFRWAKKTKMMSRVHRMKMVKPTSIKFAEARMRMQFFFVSQKLTNTLGKRSHLIRIIQTRGRHKHRCRHHARGRIASQQSWQCKPTQQRPKRQTQQRHPPGIALNIRFDRSPNVPTHLPQRPSAMLHITAFQQPPTFFDRFIQVRKNQFATQCNFLINAAPPSHARPRLPR